MNYEQLLAEFNVGAAHQVCFNAEIRMRLEHELRGRQKFEERCALLDNWLKERDAEIASLKTQLSIKEAEVAEAFRLRGQIATVEAAKAARVNELNDLKERNVALEGQVVALESAAASKDAKLASSSSQVSVLETTYSGLRDEVMGYKLFKEQIEAVKVLIDRVADLDAELMRMALHLDEEFYPYYLTALGGVIGCAIDKGIQDGLAAGIDHGKAGRVLAKV
ncbi:hypothetical protein Tco_0168684, partial [Tanacetum coccineum]